MLLSERALKLIVDFEGLNQPGKWPGGASGITIGFGYDLGHVTPAQFAADWAGGFTAEQMARLARSIGRTGEAARALAATLADIRCTVADARRVLVAVTLPACVARTRRAFPGFDVLPLDVQGALVSLVYNRGARMADSPGTDDRREMRAIRDLVANGMVAGIAEQFRSMKRLWVGKGLDGLIRRREAEAALVESAAGAMIRALGLAETLVRATSPIAARGMGRDRSATRAPRRSAAGPSFFGASRRAVIVSAWPTGSDRERSPGPRAARGRAKRPGRRLAAARVRRSH